MLSMLLEVVNPSPLLAQDVIEIQSLFEYPVAPEELPTMSEKSNYIVEHFWDKLDLKNKNTVDQNALNHAFRVYSVAMRFADRETTLSANQKLINNLVKNPTLLLQFTKAAEENIYGPRAEFWIDEVYMQFLNALSANKKITPARKGKYIKQLEAISNSKEGQIAKKFKFENRNGSSSSYFPMSTPTMIIFGDPWDTEWRMARLKIESNLKIINALDKGKINILFILPDKKDGWEDQVNNYSPKWSVGAGENLKEIYDLRMNPSVYVIGSDGKILIKNSNLQSSVETLLKQLKEE